MELCELMLELAKLDCYGSGLKDNKKRTATTLLKRRSVCCCLYRLLGSGNHHVVIQGIDFAPLRFTRQNQGWHNSGATGIHIRIMKRDH